MNGNELRARRTDHFLAADKLVKAAKKSGTDLKGEDLEAFEKHLAEIKRIDAWFARADAGLGRKTELIPLSEIGHVEFDAHGQPIDKTPSVPIPVPFAGRIGPTGEVSHIVNMERFNRELGDFMRGTSILAADVPIYVGTGAGVESVGATIPTAVLAQLAAYSNLDSFQLAGARILQTDNTNPLVLPVISAGAAASTYAEGASATESQPFELDSFTLGGVKYARLVKVTEEALMNSALPLQNVILDELASGIASTFTAAITASMVTALAANAAVLKAQGADDVYHTLLEVMHAIPPRFASLTNRWMLSRETLALIKDSRADTSGVPFFDATSGQIFGHDSVINDNLTGGRVVYGDWASGAVVRKSPFFLLPLREAFSSEGKVGFKATQWLDAKFLCELSAVSVQPLYTTLLT